MLAAYHSLAQENDILVIEGAGSPAEINLKQDDIVNMGLAKLVDAPVLLVGDIDRGGVFAQLYGTLELLEPDERARVAGCIINKFRGDVGLLKPGLTMLEEKTNIPVLGVVPYATVDLEDEDSLAPCLDQTEARRPIDIAVLRLPRISNFTALRLQGGGAGPARSRGLARHEEHDGRSALAPTERPGDCREASGRQRHARFGDLRRLPDAGPDAC